MAAGGVTAAGWAGGLALALALGCGADAARPASTGDAPPVTARSSEAPPSEAQPVTGEATTAEGPEGRLLAWLDPDAIGAALIREPLGLDAGAITTLFALPIQSARMLRELEMADEALAILFDDQVAAWVAPQALAMLPPLGRGATMVRLLRAPRAEVEAALADHEMEASVSEGYAIWSPRGGLPWRLIFLDDATIALVPTAEIGGGLGPLTAARDLPASALEQELRKAITGDPDLAIEVVAQGPFLHLDLEGDVGVVRLSLRRWRGAGIDGAVLMQALGDPEAEVAALAARAHVGESARIRELAAQVVFTAEPPMILGRVQLPAEDVVALRRRAR